jgi:hypothetical protein
MTKLYDPDPLGLGVMATLECVSCGRDRYGEVVSTKEEDVVVVGEGPVLQLPNVSCSCGETRIRTGWMKDHAYSGLEDYGDGDGDGDGDLGQTDFGFGGVQAPATRQSPLTSQTSDGYWETPTEPLPDPLPHQFRHSAGGQRWEADFEKMTLGITRAGELFLSEEPVLYDLTRGAEGRLMMRPTDESRRIMVANIQERLADGRRDRDRDRDDAADGRDRAKLIALHRGSWLDAPADIAEALEERYLAFLRNRAKQVGSL